MARKHESEFEQALYRARAVHANQTAIDARVETLSEYANDDELANLYLVGMHERLRKLLESFIHSSEYIDYCSTPSDVAGSWLEVGVPATGFVIKARAVFRADRVYSPAIQLFNLPPTSYDTFRIESIHLFVGAVLEAERHESARGYKSASSRSSDDGIKDGEIWARSCTLRTLIRFHDWAAIAVPDSTWTPSAFWRAFRENQRSLRIAFNDLVEHIDEIPVRWRYSRALRQFCVAHFWQLDPSSQDRVRWLPRPYLDGFVAGAKVVAARVVGNTPRTVQLAYLAPKEGLKCGTSSNKRS